MILIILTPSPMKKSKINKSFTKTPRNNPRMDHTEKHSFNHHNSDKIVMILKNNSNCKSNINNYNKNSQMTKVKEESLLDLN